MNLNNLIIFSFNDPWTLFWIYLGARIIIEWVLMGKNAEYQSLKVTILYILSTPLHSY